MRLYTKGDILGALESDLYLDIYEVTEKTAVVYDRMTGNGITYYFPECYTLQDLREKIHIISPMPKEARLDADRLAQYLWKYMDHKAFITLSGLWFVNREEDFRTIAEYYQNDEVEELEKIGAKGFFWYAQQACVVDVLRIRQWAEKRGLTGDRAANIRELIVSVAIHELRHQMMDATLILPVDEYPLEWGKEFFVERYARELCDETDIDVLFL